MLEEITNTAVWMAILGVIKLATIANNAPIPNQKIKNPHSCNLNHEKNSSSNKPYIPHKNLLLNYYTINCIKKEEKNAKIYINLAEIQLSAITLATLYIKSILSAGQLLSKSLKAELK